MKVLLLDNYDSFTYNLAHLILANLNVKLDIIKNDAIKIEKIKFYDKIIISPGPGLPKNAGITLQLINDYASTKSILGVCLGHQAIAEAFGARLINLKSVLHGVSTNCKIIYPNSKLFKNIKSNFKIGHYHSWVVANDNFPNCFIKTAINELDLIMALQHKNYDLHSVQFHPESILTQNGNIIISNFLSK